MAPGPSSDVIWIARISPNDARPQGSAAARVLVRMSRIFVIAALAALAITSIALAEPARTVKMGSGTYKQAWEGTGSGALATQDAMDAAGCQPSLHDCDDTLIEVTEAGSLSVKTGDSTSAQCKSSACDTDLQLFTSDQSGEVKKELQESAAATPTTNESVTARVTPGFYVARIDYAICTACTVPAEAVLKPSGTTGAPTGDAPPTVTASKPSSKKTKSFKGTAADDKGIAKVEVGIIRVKGSSCKDLKSSGKLVKHTGECTEPGVWIKAKGTTKWALKLKKALKKGKYVLFARATDTAGQTQGGYGSANRRAFTVKK
jgi:hypothetical protein